MSIPVKIEDGEGHARSAAVSPRHSLSTHLIPAPVPPVGTPSRFRFLSGLMGEQGLSQGNVNMTVDGSITPVEFVVQAEKEADLFIAELVIFLSNVKTGGGVPLSRFGGITQLTNGINLSIEEAGDTTALILNAKTDGEVFINTGAGKPFGNGAEVIKIVDWTSAQDAHVITYDFNTLMPGGLRIGRGTKDRMCLQVNDDLTGVGEFFIRVLGYRHFP